MVPQFSLFTLSWCVHNSNFIWILGFMVDISNYLLWFINKLISGGAHHLVGIPKMAG